MTARLKFSPDILQRLGEELNPSPEQGILELVRNSYDADASRCVVKLANASKVGGTLTIDDDGEGMDGHGLTDAWLVLGRSSKTPSRRTDRFERLAVGSKGLGRLAALRLGEVAELRTRPKSEPGAEYRLILDWSQFGSADTIDRVIVEIQKTKTRKEPGTTVTIRDLKRAFTKGEVRRLARALVMLASPFESAGSFVPSLSAPEFRDIEKMVRAGYWDQAAYEIRAGLRPDGRAWAEMIDNERDGRVTNGTHDDIRAGKDKAPYQAPEAEFELWVFRLASGGRTRTRTRPVSVTALREWLAVVGGVHLYHRGLRVFPYGDPGHDWLDMNLRRVQSPEERPSTNNSVGRVQVLDEYAVLQQKTDRTGFIETVEFDDLRLFAQEVLDWVARVRLKEAEARRQAERVAARDSLESAQGRLHDAISEAPPEVRRKIDKVDREVREATREKVSTLSDDLELYRTLATIGTTTAVMAHESFNPQNTIVKLALSVRKRAKALLGDDYQQIEGQIDLIESNARRMATLVNLPRRLLDRGKRERGTFSVNDVTEETLKLLGPLLDEHRVKLDRSFDESDPEFTGTTASFESIVTNLVINAVSALDRDSSKRERIVRVKTDIEEGTAILDVADNGPGIKNIPIGDIWLPGRGTTNRGVGLGLTIVRDIVVDFGGDVTAEARGELGGAQFTVKIPLAED
jgi:signal transduction histidine kinase